MRIPARAASWGFRPKHQPHRSTILSHYSNHQPRHPPILRRNLKCLATPIENSRHHRTSPTSGLAYPSFGPQMQDRPTAPPNRKSHASLPRILQPIMSLVSKTTVARAAYHFRAKRAPRAIRRAEQCRFTLCVSHPLLLILLYLHTLCSQEQALLIVQTLPILIVPAYSGLRTRALC